MRRVTLRMPVRMLNDLDRLVERDVYPNRSEAIRGACRRLEGVCEPPRVVTDGGVDVDRWLDELGDWSEDDPDVLLWAGHPKEPVIADVDGELRVFHSGLVYPWPVETDHVREFLDENGEPTVVSLSTQHDRFEKHMFEWDHPDDSEDE